MTFNEVPFKEKHEPVGISIGLHCIHRRLWVVLDILTILILAIHAPGIFPLVCSFFTFFHQSLVAFYRSSMFLVKFTPEYFIVFDAIVHGIVLKFLFQMFCC